MLLSPFGRGLMPDDIARQELGYQPSRAQLIFCIRKSERIDQYIDIDSLSQ